MSRLSAAPAAKLPPVLRIPALLIVLVLALAAPVSAFGQGAGDDQYQDPFGESTAQGGGGGGGAGDGLSATPPSGGGSSSAGAPEPAPADPAAPGTEAAPEDAAGELPDTGADPYLLALFGASLLLMGVGVRLKTVDPNAF